MLFEATPNGGTTASDTQTRTYTPDAGGNATIPGESTGVQPLPPTGTGAAYPVALKLTSTASYNGVQEVDKYTGQLTLNPQTDQVETDISSCR